MFNQKTHRNPSVMAHSFARVPQAEIPRSSFDRSHGHKTTFDAGYLIPLYLDEGLPGDTHRVNMTAIVRLATPIFPLMDNMYLDSHFFSVPLRLVWDNFQKFNGEQDDPGDSVDFTVPVMTAFEAAPLSLSDYFGIPTSDQTGAPISMMSLFHRAYNLVFNTWFRDQNLQDSVVVDRDDGPDAIADYVLLRRGKRHDYFTAALPWPQKGDSVSIPLGSTALVRLAETNFNTPFVKIASTHAGAGAATPLNSGADSFLQEGTGGVNMVIDPNGTLYTDLTTATAATINQLRQSFQIQKLLERDARGGTRYVEIVRAHFGVTSPDARLQRPEYLGGGSTPINITAIPQTSSSDGTSPQGNLSAVGVGLAMNHGFTASFTEHCLIIGLVSVRADLTYQQGLHRMFSRSTKLDFYWPALSHIGEQTVLRKEIYMTGTALDDDTVFGYQERHADYRYKPSLITGQFRSQHATSLDAWHLSQDFATPPVLDSTFIQENPPVDRVIAVDSEPHFICDSYFKIHSARPMPVYGVPGLIDHF